MTTRAFDGWSGDILGNANPMPIIMFDDLIIIANFSAQGPLLGVTLTTDIPSPQPVNTPITLAAMATGGAAVQYQFWVYFPTAIPAWQQLQAYSSSATCTWTPTTIGMYLLAAMARDGDTGKEISATLWYTIILPPLTAVSCTATPASPQSPGTRITLQAAATGGTEVQYQFWRYNPYLLPTWQQLQAYSSSATCIWTPAFAGIYLLSVTARDGITGDEVNDMSWYTVFQPLLTAVILRLLLPRRNRSTRRSP